MKVALVFDYLIRLGGAERVLMELVRIFPEVVLFALFYDKNFVRKYFKGVKIKASFLNKIPFIKKIYRLFLPIFPEAIETINLKGFDLIISVSSSFAKGVITKENQVHISYINTPTRFLWQERADQQGKTKLLKTLLFKSLREWDYLAAQRPNYLIANSKYTQLRIKKYYKRNSFVIYPPVEIPKKIEILRSKYFDKRKDYFITVSQLLAYKNLEASIKIFNKLRLKYIIIGEGAYSKRLRKMAKDNIVFKGFLEEEEKNKILKKAFCFIFPSVEDFGIAPVEAIAMGIPVIALKRGGALEWLREGINGLFFNDLNELEEKIYKIIEGKFRFKPEAIRKSVIKFSKESFRRKISSFIQNYGRVKKI